MSDTTKIGASHLSRAALRLSSTILPPHRSNTIANRRNANMLGVQGRRAWLGPRSMSS